MPYTYPIEIKESPLQGNGVFALVDIPKGTTYWVYECENPLPVKGMTLQKN